MLLVLDLAQLVRLYYYNRLIWIVTICLGEFMTIRNRTRRNSATIYYYILHTYNDWKIIWMASASYCEVFDSGE